MAFDRRRLFLALAGSAGAAVPATAREPSETRAEIDAATLGVRADAEADQSAVLQRAIDRAAAVGAVLRLPPGVYRVGGLRLPAYAAIAGVAGASRIVMNRGPSLLSSQGGDYIRLSDLVLDGARIRIADGHGLVHLTQARAVRVRDCMIVNAGGNGIMVEGVAGDIAGNMVVGAAGYAIFSNDAAGLRIAGNTVQGAGNCGIAVWRSAPGDDGTLVVDNRVEDTNNVSGGNGQWGNAINVFRADNVIVRGNRIRGATFSAVRGNAASNIQIVGNSCSDLGEVALFAEFGFQGAVIANNVVDRAAVGIGVTNFDKGGRLAVVQGNLIRDLIARRPAGSDAGDVASIGIGIEADAAVSGNVVENIPGTGISAGTGPYLRDIAITGNVVRAADYGIGVSVAPGAGTVVIADNLIAEIRHAAIVGREWDKIATGDLSKEGAERYPQLSIAGNRVR